MTFKDHQDSMKEIFAGFVDKNIAINGLHPVLSKESAIEAAQKRISLAISKLEESLETERKVRSGELLMVAPTSEYPKLEDGIFSMKWQPLTIFHNCGNRFCNRPMQSTDSDFWWTQSYCCEKCAIKSHPEKFHKPVKNLVLNEWIELTDKCQPPDKGFSKTMRVFYLTRKGFPSESKDVLSAYFCVIELPALPTDCE